MNADLLKAILSMDAYNRGYSAGIELSGTEIGDVTIGVGSENLVTLPSLLNSITVAFATAGM